MGKKEAQGEIADEMGDSSLEEKDCFNIKKMFFTQKKKWKKKRFNGGKTNT